MNRDDRDDLVTVMTKLDDFQEQMTKRLDTINDHLEQLNSKTRKNSEFRKATEQIHKNCPTASGKSYYRRSEITAAFIGAVVALAGTVITLFL